MKKEKHLQVGDLDFFTESMTQLGVEKRKVPPQNPMTDVLYGLPIVVNKNIPKDRAWLIDENGKLLQVFTLSKTRPRPCTSSSVTGVV